MGSKTSAPPPTPNPYVTSQAQLATNIETAVGSNFMNNANVNSPYGNTTFNQTGERDVGGYKVPTWTQNITLSPEQQNLYNQQYNLSYGQNNIAQDELTRLGGVLGTPISMNGAPARIDSISNGPAFSNASGSPYLQNSYDSGGGVADAHLAQYSEPTWDTLTYGVNPTWAQGGFGDVGSARNVDPLRRNIQEATWDELQQYIDPSSHAQDRNAVESALFQRLNPQLDQRRQGLESQLTNQGFVRGTQAWTNAMDDYNREANDARLGVTAKGLQEQQGLFGMDLNAGQFHNAATGQRENMILGRYGFENNASLQEQQANNAAQQQNYTQALGRTGLYNQAAGQNNAADLAAANFHNAASGQREKMIQDYYNQYNDTAMKQQGANNAAQLQRNSQNAAAAGFYNQAAQSGFNNNYQANAYNNTIAQQAYGNQVGAAQFQDTARERALQEQLALRNQQINEVSTLTRGGQVSMPQFSPFKGSTINPVDLSGNVNAAATIDSNNWKTQTQADAAALGGLYSLGGTIAGAGISKYSERRLKRDITRVGTLKNGLPIYTYRYILSNKLEIGAMVDEAEILMPEAVVDMGFGAKGLDYSIVWKVA